VQLSKSLKYSSSLHALNTRYIRQSLTEGLERARVSFSKTARGVRKSKRRRQKRERVRRRKIRVTEERANDDTSLANF